jgi:hypothetical protein
MNHTTYITAKPWIESPRKLLSVLLQFQQRFPSSLTSSHLRKFENYGKTWAVDHKFWGLYAFHKDFQKKRGLRFSGSCFNIFPVK